MDIADIDGRTFWVTAFGALTEVDAHEFCKRYKAYFMSRDVVCEDVCLERIVRYCIQTVPPQLFAPSVVKSSEFNMFLHWFGPMILSYNKALSCVFDEARNLVPWYHGNFKPRDPAAPGEFYVRVSTSKPECLMMAYRKCDPLDTELHRCYIYNYKEHGYSFEEVVTPGRMFDSIRKVVEDNMRADRSAIKTPVPSLLYEDYVRFASMTLTVQPVPVPVTPLPSQLRPQLPTTAQSEMNLVQHRINPPTPDPTHLLSQQAQVVSQFNQHATLQRAFTMIDPRGSMNSGDITGDPRLMATLGQQATIRPRSPAKVLPPYFMAILRKIDIPVPPHRPLSLQEYEGKIRDLGEQGGEGGEESEKRPPPRLYMQANFGDYSDQSPISTEMSGESKFDESRGSSNGASPLVTVTVPPTNPPHFGQSQSLATMDRSPLLHDRKLAKSPNLFIGTDATVLKTATAQHTPKSPGSVRHTFSESGSTMVNGGSGGGGGFVHVGGYGSLLEPGSYPGGVTSQGNGGFVQPLPRQSPLGGHNPYTELDESGRLPSGRPNSIHSTGISVGLPIVMSGSTPKEVLQGPPVVVMGGDGPFTDRINDSDGHPPSKRAAVSSTLETVGLTASMSTSTPSAVDLGVPVFFSFTPQTTPTLPSQFNPIVKQNTPILPQTSPLGQSQPTLSGSSSQTKLPKVSHLTDELPSMRRMHSTDDAVHTNGNLGITHSHSQSDSVLLSCDIFAEAEATLNAMLQANHDKFPDNDTLTAAAAHGKVTRAAQKLIDRLTIVRAKAESFAGEAQLRMKNFPRAQSLLQGALCELCRLNATPADIHFAFERLMQCYDAQGLTDDAIACCERHEKYLNGRRDDGDMEHLTTVSYMLAKLRRKAAIGK